MLTILRWQSECFWSSFGEQVTWQVDEQSAKQVVHTARGLDGSQIWNRIHICVGAPVRDHIQNALRSPM